MLLILSCDKKTDQSDNQTNIDKTPRAIIEQAADSSLRDTVIGSDGQELHPLRVTKLYDISFPEGWEMSQQDGLYQKMHKKGAEGRDDVVEVGQYRSLTRNWVFAERRNAKAEELDDLSVGKITFSVFEYEATGTYCFYTDLPDSTGSVKITSTLPPDDAELVSILGSLKWR